MFSFYHLPSTVMNHPQHNILNVAYFFYSFHTATPLRDLLYDALVLAKKVRTMYNDDESLYGGTS